jgi:serine protease Do
MKELMHRVPGRRRRTLVAALLASTLIAGGGFAFADGHAATAPTGPLELPPVVNQAGFANLVAKVRPAIVNIATTEAPAQVTQQAPPDLQQPMPPFLEGTPFGEMFRQFLGQQGSESMAPTQALGSGFIIDPAGYIVTNNHVIDHAHKITVTLNDGSSYPVHVVGRDSKTDLALLKIDAGRPVPYLAFGNSDKERVGDWVVAVGNPFGLGGTVTAGIISAHDRNLQDGPYDDYLQIDAPINPGNSGGPLFNQSGEVIGIDTAIYSPNGGSVGIGFAIPSNLAKNVVAQLREHGKVERGWLGVEMQGLTPALAKAIGRPDAQGVIIDQVEPNSPAAKAKLEQGDVITAFDGKVIKTPRDLALDVANTPHGNKVKLTLWRDGHERTAEVAIGEQRSQQVAQGEPATGGGTRLGMELAPLTPRARSNLGLNPTVNGVVVAGVQPESRAADSGMRADDVILRIGSTRVTSPAEAAAQIHQAERDRKEAVPLLVMRNGTTYYLALRLAKS